MVVAIKIPNHLPQNLFHCDVGMLVVSFDYAAEWGYPLRVEGLVFDALCHLPMPKP